MQDQASVIRRSVNLLERAVILLFGTVLLLTVLFVAGNYQNFTDVTQLQLLGTLQTLSGVSTILTALTGALELAMTVRSRMWRGFWRAGALLVATIVSFGLTVGSSGILVFLRPL